MRKILKYQEPTDTGVIAISEDVLGWLRKGLTSFLGSKEKRAEKKAEKLAFAGTPEGKEAIKVKENSLNIAGTAVDILPGLLGGRKADEDNPVLDTALDTVGNAVGSLGMYGKLAQLGIKGFQALNNYAGKTIDSLDTAGQTATGYTVENSITAGKKFSLLNSGKKLKNANRFNNRINHDNIQKLGISYNNQQNQLAASGMLSTMTSKYNTDLSGGINYNIISVKFGGKVSPKDFKIIKAKVGVKLQKIQSGEALSLIKTEEIKTQNVIPEGALHARLNNYEGELGEQVTNKGIPVITYEKEDKILQHAEIEHSEIIFNKTTSDKLEELYKEYKNATSSKKKELEIECGKLLTVEILENTNDNVGLLNNIK